MDERYRHMTKVAMLEKAAAPRTARTLLLGALGGAGLMGGLHHYTNPETAFKDISDASGTIFGSFRPSELETSASEKFRRESAAAREAFERDRAAATAAYERDLGNLQGDRARSRRRAWDQLRDNTSNWFNF